MRARTFSVRGGANGVDWFFTLLGAAFFAVLAAFSYEMPILLARLLGQEPALNALWASVSQDSVAIRIVFITVYMIVGTALWAGPLVYVTGLLHPRYSRRYRDG